MKKITCLVITLFALAACSGSKSSELDKLTKTLNDHLGKYQHYVLALEVGKNVEVQKEAYTDHMDHVPTAGTPMDWDQRAIMVNYVLNGYVMGCLGCNECMKMFRDAGLINYKVKSETERTYICDISLTKKGKKYRLQNYMPSIQLKDQYAEAKNYEFVVLSHSRVANLKLLKNYADNRYLCEGDVVSVVTPFLTSQGYDPEKDTHKGYHRTWDVRYNTSRDVSQARKHDKNVKDYEVREVTEISYLLGYDVKSYDLNEYTKEEALKHHLCLSDTLAHVSVVYDEWNGMYISGYGRFDDIEEMPDEVQDAFLFQDGRKHCFLLGVSSLGKIISDSKMPDYPDAKGQLAWNLNEIRYTVNSKYTKFAAGKYECDQKMTYYGKIPYIVIGDIMYFIPEAYSSYGLWATTKKAMEKMSYDPESEQNVDVIYPRSVFADGMVPLRYVEDML